MKLIELKLNKIPLFRVIFSLTKMFYVPRNTIVPGDFEVDFNKYHI